MPPRRRPLPFNRPSKPSPLPPPDTDFIYLTLSYRLAACATHTCAICQTPDAAPPPIENLQGPRPLYKGICNHAYHALCLVKRLAEWKGDEDCTSCKVLKKCFAQSPLTRMSLLKRLKRVAEEDVKSGVAWKKDVNEVEMLADRMGEMQVNHQCRDNMLLHLALQLSPPPVPNPVGRYRDTHPFGWKYVASPLGDGDADRAAHFQAPYRRSSYSG